MSQIWSIKTGYDININTRGGVAVPEREPYSYTLPLIYPGSTTTEVISGSLPPGLRLVDNVITGMPFEVVTTRKFSFVIRATYDNTISDKTFYLSIAGADTPEWITNEGQLPIGPGDTYYVLDESYIDFQLVAVDNDTAAGQVLSFWIASNDGALPPGITLSRSGRIYGWVKPTLSIPNQTASGYYDTIPYDQDVYDLGTLNSYGYDSYSYDFLKYDYAEFYARPKKLNRNYEFVVTISDGTTITKRKFRIFVIGDQSFMVDTTIVVSDQTNITTDVSSVRAPVWITDSDLGYRRANNYQTFKLDIYETVDKSPVIYTLESKNPNGTASRLPTGLEFDTNTSEIFGVIPYQPAVTKDYTFTVTATRIGPLKENPTSSDELYPLLVNEDVNYEGKYVYRRQDLELSTGKYRVYRSSTTVAEDQGQAFQFNGLELYQVVENGKWVFIYNGFNLMYYSANNIDYVWDAKVWYTTPALTTEVTNPPSIEVIPTGVTVYTDYYQSASTSKTFTLKVIGEIDNNISWTTDNDLGTLEAEHTSNLFVNAVCVDNSVVNYSLVSGALPPGLHLDSDGQIIGKVIEFNEYHYNTDFAVYGNSNQLTPTDLTTLDDIEKQPGDTYRVARSGWFTDGVTTLYANTSYMLTWNALGFLEKVKTTEVRNRLTKFDFTIDGSSTTIDRVFKFDILASDNALSKQTIRTFSITVTTPNAFKVSNLVVTPMMVPLQRELFRNFITNMEVFDSHLLYRPGDVNYGIQDTLSMLIYAGIQTPKAQEVMAMVEQNHKRKRFKFGDIKIAQAKAPATHDVLYEVIYVQMLDPLEIGSKHLPLTLKTSKENEPVSKTTTIDSTNIKAWDSNLEYKQPSSITLWRKRIADMGLEDRHFLPLWMRTIQDGSMVELNYTPAVVLCYCKTGQASTILLNIKNYMKTTGLDFSQFDYDIDRYIITSVEEYNHDKYVVFPNNRTTVS